MDRKGLIYYYRLNLHIIKSQTNGLTHADSILQLPFRGNCMNWVLGHLINSRDIVFSFLDVPTILNEKEKQLYQYGSTPITSASQEAMTLDSLMESLGRSQEVLEEAINSLKDEEFDRKVNWDERELSLFQFIQFFHWHEAYHTGQLELLRQLAGKNDSII
ncbi:MAG: DinB family protein [Anaerolineaceae bacterium]|nr:DinB family protein [Anaerolineaceae bacterium]